MDWSKLNRLHIFFLLFLRVYTFFTWSGKLWTLFEKWRVGLSMSKVFCKKRKIYNICIRKKKKKKHQNLTSCPEIDFKSHQICDFLVFFQSRGRRGSQTFGQSPRFQNFIWKVSVSRNLFILVKCIQKYILRFILQCKSVCQRGLRFVVKLLC